MLQRLTRVPRAPRACGGSAAGCGALGEEERAERGRRPSSSHAPPRRTPFGSPPGSHGRSVTDADPPPTIRNARLPASSGPGDRPATQGASPRTRRPSRAMRPVLPEPKTGERRSAAATSASLAIAAPPAAVDRRSDRRGRGDRRRASRESGRQQAARHRDPMTHGALCGDRRSRSVPDAAGI